MKLEQALKIIQQNKTAYNLIGNEFAATRQRLWPEIELLVKKYVKAGDKVLDIGCGNGRLLKALPAVDYCGIEVSSVLLKQARQTADRLNFRQANFKELDMLELHKLGDKGFDVIFMLASFNHIPSQELRLKVLQAVRKLLKSGGLIIMMNWNMWQWRYKKSIWQYKIIMPLKQIIGRAYRNPEIKNWQWGLRDIITVWQNGDKSKQGELYYRAFTKTELKKLFKQSGFKVLENYYSLDGKKASWWQAKNIVSVVRLTF